MLEELRRSNKENQKLQNKLILMYENSGCQNDSDQESPGIENQFFNNNISRYGMSNAKEDNLVLNLDEKSYDLEDDSFNIDNSKSMMMSRNEHSHNNSLSRFLTIPSRLNETVISNDKKMNKFNKKVLIQKDKEIEEKSREIDEISKKYEAKINELNKSRNEDRQKYAKEIEQFRTDTLMMKSGKSRPSTTKASKTPIVFFDCFTEKALNGDKKKPILQQIDDESEDEELDTGRKSNLFLKIEEITGQYESLRKSIASQITDNNRD